MKSASKIVQYDESATNPLRCIAVPVKPSEFGTPELKKIIKSMQAALAKESDGVALAAPQIGITKRIFVVAPSSYEETAKWKPLVFINPTITKMSKKMMEQQEGCLSVRWIYGKTKRHISATVDAYDENGNKFTFGGSGLLAHIFQHEVDHLDGVLFIDHGYDLEEYTEEEIKAGQKKN